HLKLKCHIRIIIFLNPLLSTTDGRFLRAWLPASSLAKKRSLRGLKTHAFPAEVAAFRFKDLVSCLSYSLICQMSGRSLMLLVNGFRIIWDNSNPPCWYNRI